MSVDEKSSLAATTPWSTSLDAPSRAHRRRVVLLVYHRDGVEMTPLHVGQRIVVGRESPADVVIRDVSLSRRHACFTLDADGVAVEDLGSLNGTCVGGQRVARCALKAGDEVALGAITVSVHILDGAGAPLLGLEGHDSFRDALGVELARARFFQREAAMLVVRPLHAGHGQLRHFCSRIRGLVRSVDRVALYGGDTLEILLLESGSEQALRIARAIVAGPQGEPALGCGVAIFPAAATSVETLLEASHDAARRTRVDERIQTAPPEGPSVWVPPLEPVAGDVDEDQFLTRSPRMREIVEVAKRLARANIPVLLSGETGVGKEVLSRLIHDVGPRRNHPLICVNCGAIPSQLVESTLFGHERGAFTGALQQHKGVFEAADHGTVLLDEIGELPAAAQAALLRVLESRRITRVGATKEIEIDVRVLAATHRDLDAMCATGSFRLDLLFRLNAATLEIPPLRERREDIAPLAARFLRLACKENGCGVRTLSSDARTILEAHSWPGNIRELKNAIERAIAIGEGDEVTIQDLPVRVRGSTSSPATREAAADDDESTSSRGGPQGQAAQPGREPQSGAHPPRSEAPRGVGLKERMKQIESELILDALSASGENQTEAARLLDVPLRTLQYKIRELELRRGGYRSV